jgi:hypothetical protein
MTTVQKPDAGQPKAPASGPGSKPGQDETARKAYDIYLREGRPKGHEMQNWLEAEKKMPHCGAKHHGHMMADFRNRFWISLAFILITSDFRQQ